MGVVYEAEQASLKRKVALKVLPPGLRMDPRLLARFQREAEAAGRLRHPGIVPVFSVGSAAGTPFFAMERVEGRSLESIIAALRRGGDAGVPPSGPDRVRWAVDTIAKVADALAYAHEQGILHRDVKPGNILIDADGTPRLTDFGLALDMDAPGLTMAGEVFGSPRYMSPEQAVRREAPLDQRTDVYSTAVTLYELLTLRLPYEGTSTAELLTALAAGRVVPPKEANPDLPGPVAAVLERALERDPKDRYAGAAEFAADLRRAIDGGAAPRAAVRPPKRRRRKWSKILLGAAMALAFLYGISLGVRNWILYDEDDLGDIALTIPQLKRMADVEFVGAEALLAERMTPEVTIRKVLSRANLGNYSLKVRFNLKWGGELHRPLMVAAYWTASVNGGDWVRAGEGYIVIGKSTGIPEDGEMNVSTNVLGANPLLEEVLGDAVAGSTVRLRHRMAIRVGYRPDDWIDPWQTRPQGSTEWTWTSDETICLIFDDYPDDYPETVSSDEIDAAMRAANTPVVIEVGEVDTDDSGNRLLGMLFHFDGDAGPIPAACDLSLRHPEKDVELGTGTFTVEAAEPLAPGVEVVKFSRILSIPVQLNADLRPEQKHLLLDLLSGRQELIRVVLEPSRSAALGEPTFERYWGGALDVVVPVRPTPEGGIKARPR
jgi:hypothetical protein